MIDPTSAPPSDFVVRRSAALAVGVVGLVFAVAVAAADKPKESSFGKPRAGSPLLTRAQLRDCLAQQDRLPGATAEATAQQAGLVAAKAEIERAGETAQARLATLDRTDAVAVDAYNAEVQARDRMIERYEDGVRQYNARAVALNAEKAAFAAACGNRRYDEAEEALIRKGR